MADEPKIAERGQVLDSFFNSVWLAKQREMESYAAFFPLTSTGTISADRESEYEEAAAVEIEVAVGRALGGADNDVGVMPELQALAIQNDFINSRRRARSLRKSSFTRRWVHTANRRASHAQRGGYYERRVEGLVVRLLQISNNVRPPSVETPEATT